MKFIRDPSFLPTANGILADLSIHRGIQKDLTTLGNWSVTAGSQKPIKERKKNNLRFVLFKAAGSVRYEEVQPRIPKKRISSSMEEWNPDRKRIDSISILLLQPPGHDRSVSSMPR